MSLMVGNLVFFKKMPIFDENMHKANLLGLVMPDRIPDEPFLDHLATETLVDLNGYTARTRAPFYVYDSKLPGDPIWGEQVDADIRDSDFEENIYLRSLVIGHKYKVGYHEKRGKGSITVLGVEPTADFVLAIHRFLGITVPVLSTSPEIKPALFRGRDAYYLVLINIADYPVQTLLEIDTLLIGNQGKKATDLRNVVVIDDTNLNEGRLYVKLPRKNGTIIEIRGMK